MEKALGALIALLFLPSFLFSQLLASSGQECRLYCGNKWGETFIGTELKMSSEGPDWRFGLGAQWEGSLLGLLEKTEADGEAYLENGSELLYASGENLTLWAEYHGLVFALLGEASAVSTGELTETAYALGGCAGWDSRGFSLFLKGKTSLEQSSLILAGGYEGNIYWGFWSFAGEWCVWGEELHRVFFCTGSRDRTLELGAGYRFSVAEVYSPFGVRVRKTWEGWGLGFECWLSAFGPGESRVEFCILW